MLEEEWTSSNDSPLLVGLRRFRGALVRGITMTPGQDAAFFFRLTRYILTHRWLSLRESEATRQTANMYACTYGYCSADQREITLERNSLDTSGRDTKLLPCQARVKSFRKCCFFDRCERYTRTQHKLMTFDSYDNYVNRLTLQFCDCVFRYLCKHTTKHNQAVRESSFITEDICTANLSCTARCQNPGTIFRSNQRGDIMLPLQTLTLHVLCGLPLQWPYKRWPAIPRDLLASLLCIYGHSLTGTPPRLPFSLAVAYVVWVSTPGSFRSLTLPRHSEFMCNLTLPPNEEPEECKVCWDDVRLARMPCGHRFCKRCLQLMGEQFQTACPMCRVPLFSRHDRAMFIVSKSAVAISALNLAIYAPLKVLREVQAGKYALVVISLCSTLPMIFHLLFTTYQCRKKGENWWRDSAENTKEPTSRQLKAAGFA